MRVYNDCLSLDIAWRMLVGSLFYALRVDDSAACAYTPVAPVCVFTPMSNSDQTQCLYPDAQPQCQELRNHDCCIWALIRGTTHWFCGSSPTLEGIYLPVRVA